MKLDEMRMVHIYIGDSRKVDDRREESISNAGGFLAIPNDQPMIETLTERDRKIELLWEELSDIPVNPETEELEEPFHYFPAGTNRKDIWHWFDQRYSRGVAHLLYGDGIDRTDDVAEYVFRKGMCLDCESGDCAYNVRGECRYPLIGERKAKIDDDGCSDYVFGRN